MFKSLFTRSFQDAADEASDTGTPLYKGDSGYIAADKTTRGLFGVSDDSLEFIPLDREGADGEWPCRDTTDDR